MTALPDNKEIAETSWPEEILWPEEVLKEYLDMKVPTLYEMLISYEKLSVEIRRQNKEIQTVHQSLEQLTQRLQTLDQKEENDDEEKPEENTDTALISYHPVATIMDSLRNLSELIQSSLGNLKSSMPQGFWRGIFQNAAWHTHNKNVLESLENAGALIMQKCMQTLADEGIECIHPLPGDLFDPLEHRALTTDNKGAEGTIAQLVRYGYRKNSMVLRPADVIINKHK